MKKRILATVVALTATAALSVGVIANASEGVSASDSDNKGTAGVTGGGSSGGVDTGVFDSSSSSSSTSGSDTASSSGTSSSSSDTQSSSTSSTTTPSDSSSSSDNGGSTDSSTSSSTTDPDDNKTPVDVKPVNIDSVVTVDPTKAVEFATADGSFGVKIPAAAFGEGVTDVNVAASFVPMGAATEAQIAAMASAQDTIAAVFAAATGVANTASNPAATVNGFIDITFTDKDGNPIQPVNGAIAVTVAWDGASNYAAYIDDKGNVELYPLAVAGDKATFDATHFSTYFFVTVDEKAAEKIDTDGTGATIAPNGSTNGTGTNPATGVAIAVIPAAIGAAVVAICVAKKRK